jgi:anti-sigma28 factor (negative regulator of flagellin synthesis)
MYWHTPVSLRGPVTSARAWWNTSDVRPNTVEESSSAGATAVVDEEIRADLVARVRQEIADGCYDTSEKWEAALDRMLASLA